MDAAPVEWHLRLPWLRPHEGGRLQACYPRVFIPRVLHRGIQRGRPAAGRRGPLLWGDRLGRHGSGGVGLLLYRSTTTAMFVLCFPSHVLSASFFSLSRLVVTQIWGHIAGSSPPSTPRFVPFVFIVRRVKLFLSPSTRVEFVPTHARHSQ